MFELIVSAPAALLRIKDLKAVSNSSQIRVTYYGVIEWQQISRVTCGDWRNIFRKGKTYIRKATFSVAI